MSNVFLAVEPLHGWRTVAATARRDRAHSMRDLAGHYSDAARIVVALDDFNTHNAASCYEAFPPTSCLRVSRTMSAGYDLAHSLDPLGLTDIAVRAQGKEANA